MCKMLTHLITFKENRSKRDLVAMLAEKGYPTDPVKAWKKSVTKDEIMDNESETSSVVSSEGGPDFNYILNMNLWSLSKEKKEELLAERDRKVRYCFHLLIYP